MSPITFNPLWPTPLIALIGLAALAVTLWAYAGSGGGASGRMRILFLGLRVAALMVALLCLLRPSVRTVKVYEEKAKVVVLLDRSESMTICDGEGGRARIAELNERLTEEQARLTALCERFDVSMLQFGSEVYTSTEGDVPAEDPTTALGDALTASLTEAQGRRMAAVLVLSDGSHNTGIMPQAASHVCLQQAARIVSVGFGQSTGAVATKDVQVKSVKCPRTVYVKNILTVSAELLFLGCDGEVVEVSLLFGDDQVDSKKAQITGNRVTSTVEFQHVPAEVGTYKVKVAAARVEQELVTANNEMASFVRVLPGGFNILYLEGRPRPEFKFLKRCFQSAAGMDIVAPLIFAFRGKRMGRHVPESMEQWQQYDLVILGDLACDAFRMSQLEDLHQAVFEHGLGLLMIGGVRNFGAGGYANTPVGRMLPVAVAGPEAQQEDEFRLTPTAEGEEHFALRLATDPAENQEAWQTVASLKGYLALGQPKAAAGVLATDGKDHPILVVQRYGKGRTMAFATDSTWRWVLSEHDTAAYYKRLWRQLALWLAGREEQGNDVVFLQLDEVRYPKGEKVRIRAVAEDKDGRAIEDANVTVKIRSPSGAETPVPLRFSDGIYKALYFPTETGDYDVALEATRGDEPIGTDTGRFLVYERNLELDEPDADLDTLRAIAQATHGAYFPSDELGGALDFVAGLKSESKVKKTETRDVWDNPLAFYVFVSLLCVEWLLRKVLGFV